MLPPSRRASGPTSETGRKWTPAAFPHTAWLLLVGLYKHPSLKVLRACLPLLIPLWVPTPTPFRAEPGSKDPVTVLPQLQFQHLSLAQRPLELVCNMGTRMQAAWSCLAPKLQRPFPRGQEGAALGQHGPHYLTDVGDGHQTQHLRGEALHVLLWARGKARQASPGASSLQRAV